jgi:hypothetical protein
MSLSNKLLAALPADQSKEEFEKRATAARDILDHYALVLNKGLEAHKASMKQPKQYEVANWAYKQADSMGYQRALEEAIKLLTIKD